MKYVRYVFMAVVGLYVFFVIFVSPFTKADWTRIQTWKPSPKDTQYYVATYSHNGPIDPQITPSTFPLFITIGYDFAKTPCQIYSKTTPDQSQALAAQVQVEEYVKSRMVLHSPPASQKPKVLKCRILMADPCVDALEYYMDEDDTE